MAQRREVANSIGREAFGITGELYGAAESQVVTKCYPGNPQRGCSGASKRCELQRRLPVLHEQIADAPHGAKRRSPASIAADFAAQAVDMGIETAGIGRPLAQ